METPSKAKWIWYPGDFEIWLGNRFNNRRTERGAMFPPFWKQDSHWPMVEFSRSFCLDQPEEIKIAVEGDYNLMLDGKLQFGMPSRFLLPAGEHKLQLKVCNQTSPPALFVEGEHLYSDPSWLATYEDKIWIDENGIAHGSGIYVPAASWQFDSVDTPPSAFRLACKEQAVQHEEHLPNGRLYDFGRESFGYLRFKQLEGQGSLHVYYGESRQEALDKEHCETLDHLVCHASSPELVTTLSKAFRYVYVETEGNIRYRDLSMDFEYAESSHPASGSFRCNDELLNRIWQVSAYTMDLTTREFFVDGIKRDRWTWSGDAVQSYLMNYYLRFDNECVKRTIRQLRGKDPVTAHINTIMDYTFYWFKSVYDYYLFTGDLAFVRELYPRMRSLMDYVLHRTHPENGMLYGQPDDWIFVDWVDFDMHKRGCLCFEQILFCQSLETMALCAELLRDHPLQCPPQGSLSAATYNQDALHYTQLASRLRCQFTETFWDSDKHAFIHSLEETGRNEQITKFPNMFALLYGYLSDEQLQEVMQHVLLNPSIEKITTPYMRFYELEALCRQGLQREVLNEMRDYWGGMLAQGATSFWEKYNPAEQGDQHLAMYGRPYGKSLCHAWGASPIYLLGRYYLGVEPLSPGYEQYQVRPILGDLEWMEGQVPTPFGSVYVYCNRTNVKVYSSGGCGYLLLTTAQGQQRYDIPVGENLEVTYQML